MVFEEIIRYSPRRRASHSIAEGFSPTARAVERIYFSISIISVTVLAARFWECSTLSNWFNLYENCYKLVLDHIGFFGYPFLRTMLCERDQKLTSWIKPIQEHCDGTKIEGCGCILYSPNDCVPPRLSIVRRPNAAE